MLLSEKKDHLDELLQQAYPQYIDQLNTDVLVKCLKRTPGLHTTIGESIITLPIDGSDRYLGPLCAMRNVLYTTYPQSNVDLLNETLRIQLEKLRPTD